MLFLLSAGAERTFLGVLVEFGDKVELSSSDFENFGVENFGIGEFFCMRGEVSVGVCLCA